MTWYPLQIKDNYTFEFRTINDLLYKVYFVDSTWMFEEYPQIECPIYSFNLEAIEGNPALSVHDNRIGDTIGHIMDLFFSNINNIAVYVCESIDTRQMARKRKFDYWFNKYKNENLLKEDGVAVLNEEEVTYNSIIVHKDNEYAIQILEAYKELNEANNNK